MRVDAIETAYDINHIGYHVYASLAANETTSKERLQNTRRVESPRTQRVEPLELVTGEHKDMLYNRTGRRGMLVKTGTNFNEAV